MTTEPEQKSFLIMVVEDQETMRFFATEVLKQAGFDVVGAENGAQALALFESHQPDFILMDVIMPVLDGFTACEALRAQPYGKHVPILMMTGTKNEQSIIRAYDAGATDFIGKPISRVVLPHRVRYILRAKQTADRLRESEAQLANAQRIAKLGHWQYNSSNDKLTWSSEISRLFGLTPKAASGNLDTWLRYVHTDDREHINRIFQNALHNHGTHRSEYQIVCADGTERIAHLETEAYCDASGDIQLIGTLQDITDRRWAETQIHQLAYYDSVTGLANRTSLLAALRNMLAQAKKSRQSIGIFFLDLDQFKLINDTLGHSSGDELLRQVARRLQNCVRTNDTVSRIDITDQKLIADKSRPDNMIARLGGDEFVIVINNLHHSNDAAQVAQRMLNALASAFLIEEHEIYVTASIGISIYPDNGKDLDSLLQFSDIAMYHAKRQGRDRYQFYEKSINTQFRQRLVIKNDLRRALDLDQLSLHYQPRIDVSTGQVASVEALLRWQHPEQGLIPPNQFIPLAEESGLIVRLGEWVLRSACTQTKAWQVAGIANAGVSVNLAATQFNRRDLANTVSCILKETGLAPASLELEVTESTVMDSTESGISLLDELKAIGLSIAIDDFGTGYSSLAYLKRFPIDVLKIDRSFIRDIGSDNDSAIIVAATIDLAHNLSLKVTAEGVEQQSQLDYLRSRGCDEVQGFLFAKPMPLEKLTEWFKKHHQITNEKLKSTQKLVERYFLPTKRPWPDSLVTPRG